MTLPPASVVTVNFLLSPESCTKLIELTVHLTDFGGIMLTGVSSQYRTLTSVPLSNSETIASEDLSERGIETCSRVFGSMRNKSESSL